MEIAVVCAMNQNRSMEAHAILRKEGYSVHSYGTNPTIRLPGASAGCPNEYPYSVSYREIYEDLVQKDEGLYRANGLLMLMERNMQIKERPEHFFNTARKFDIVITCEQRCFEAIFDHYAGLGPSTGAGHFHLVNFDICDTQKDALVGSRRIAEFVAYLAEYDTGDMEKTVEKAFGEYLREETGDFLFSVIDY